MKLHSMGIDTRHETGLTINRPSGSGDFLLVIFKTHAYVEYRSQTISVQPNEAVLFAQNTPQIYGSDNLYINHWVHFECAENDPFFYDVPVNFGIPVPVASITAAENVLTMLGMENMSGDSEGKAEDLLLKLLLLRTFGTGQKDQTSHSELLRKLRSEIYATPSGDYSVSTLAQKLHVSGTYFQNIYKKEFHVSIGEDIIQARILAAKYYLKNTTLSITEISDICGYKNKEHFIRQFHARIGVTASDYRRKSQNTDSSVTSIPENFALSK